MSSTVVNVKNASGKSMSNVKRENRSLLLTQLYFKGMKSRTALARELGLTPAAMTQITGNLIKEGLIQEIDAFRSGIRMGRPQQMVDIPYGRLWAVGVTMTSDRVRICISNLLFECVYEDTWTLEPGDMAEYADFICNKIAFGLFKKRIDRSAVIGIGITVRGNVDSERGVSENSFGLLPLHAEIKEEMEGRIGIPVMVDNQIRSIMICQALTSRQYPENALLIRYGPGIGSAITINGHLYSGGHSMAGEIGHLVVDNNGLKCRCGKRGCLETISSFRAMRAKLPASLECETISDLLRLFDQGNSEVIEVLNQSIVYLVHAIANTVTLFDPKHVILYGEPFNSAAFLRTFLDTIDNETPTLKSLIEISAYNMDLDGNMASALALHAFLESGGRNTII